MAEAELRAEIHRLAEGLRVAMKDNANLKRQMEVASLRVENASLRKAQEQGITLKVSPRGAVSLYGIQRFPVTLYRNQWERVLSAADEIRSFVVKNDAKLSKGPDDDRFRTERRKENRTIVGAERRKKSR